MEPGREGQEIEVAQKLRNGPPSYMSLSIIFAVALLIDTKVFTPVWLFDGGVVLGVVINCL